MQFNSSAKDSPDNSSDRGSRCPMSSRGSANSNSGNSEVGSSEVSPATNRRCPISGKTSLEFKTTSQEQTAQTSNSNQASNSAASNSSRAEEKTKLSLSSRRVLRLALPHKQTLIWGFIALGLGAAINLLFPFVIRAVLNQQFGFVLARDLGLIAGLLIGLFAIQALFFYYRHYCFYVVGHRVVTTLRQQLFDSMLLQDIEFFDRSRVGDLLSRLSSDCEHIQRALTVNISVAVRYLIQVIGGTVLMLVISAKLTLVILVLVPVIVVASIFWGKKLRTLSKKMQAELGQANVIAEEAVTSVRTVRTFAGNSYESQRYASAVIQALGSGIARTKLAAQFSSGMVFIMHSAIAVAIWYGGTLVLTGELSPGDLTGFLLYCVIVSVSFGFLANTWTEFMQAVGASERIFEIVDHQPLVISSLAPKPLEKSGAGSITFDSVSFSYPSRTDKPALRGISLEIKAGQTVALVGPSGAGKSTVAALIPRFYDPTAGTISYRGIPLAELDLTELREQISVVAQQPQVFSISIGENIRYGRLSATDSEVQAAAKAANLDEFVSSLPEGYNTTVGDKGIQLSGGERQRVAIARALLKDPQFLILDEATSSLDSENEQMIQEALERLIVNRSTLIIAHRLSTVAHADIVHVLQNGEICQTGTHQQLLETPGLYQTLVQHQLL